MAGGFRLSVPRYQPTRYVRSATSFNFALYVHFIRDGPDYRMWDQESPRILGLDISRDNLQPSPLVP